MEAKELRIGNWITFDEYNVKVLNIGQYYTFEKHLPIPITFELLEKCGFQKQTTLNGDLDIYNKGEFILYGSCLEHGFRITVEGTKKDEYLQPNIFYLHQLQNIFYFLTNLELQINL